MNALIRAIERLTGSVGVFAALLIVPLILATSYEVFARYLFDAPTVWAYEIGYMLTGSHFLLAMAFALREGQHIRIDIFSEKFSQRTRALIDLACYAVVLPLTIWLTFALARPPVERLRAQRAQRAVGAQPAGVAVPRGLRRRLRPARAAGGGRDGEAARGSCGQAAG